MQMNMSELCARELYDQCYAIKDRTPLVRLKGTPKKQDPFEHFFDDEPRWALDFTVLPKLDGRTGIWRKDSIVRKVWVFFSTNDQKIIDAYIRLRWGNDLRAGMVEMGHYGKLKADYLQFFADRREMFLKEEEKALEQVKTANLVQGKMPRSHGGVANLLKVLTKTMISQGSSIQTIARVQYAVCIQAGIMLPNEFLTDVLVADAMMEGQP